MTPRELERAVRLWQERLGLSSWKVEIALDEHPADDAHAAIWRARDYDEAKLYLDREWPSWSDRRVHEVVVHELLHLVLRDVEFVGNLIEGQLHRDVEDVIRKSHMHHVEQVDRLAHRLVDLVGPSA